MKKSITAEEFDKKFDDGEDVSEYIDWSSARRLNTEAKRVNVDFPTWMVEALDKESSRIGITRQAFIKVVVAERLGEFGRS
jgi:predicted DNA binding CopG/RHH family protein